MTLTVPGALTILKVMVLICVPFTMTNVKPRIDAAPWMSVSLWRCRRKATSALGRHRNWFADLK